MPIIVRPILKKFNGSGTVTNLPGRGSMIILPSITMWRMIREPKKSPKITVGEVSKTTIRHDLKPTNYLEGMPDEAISWISLNATGTMFFG